MLEHSLGMDPTYPLVPVANFLACILVLLSLSKNILRPVNVGVCSFAVWIAMQGLIAAINSIIWSNNVEVVAVVWCDISERSEVLCLCLHFG